MRGSWYWLTLSPVIERDFIHRDSTIWMVLPLSGCLAQVTSLPSNWIYVNLRILYYFVIYQIFWFDFFYFIKKFCLLYFKFILKIIILLLIFINNNSFGIFLFIVKNFIILRTFYVNKYHLILRILISKYIYI